MGMQAAAIFGFVERRHVPDDKVVILFGVTRSEYGGWFHSSHADECLSDSALFDLIRRA